MRILHFADGYLPRIGGIGTLVRNLCRVQTTRGHSVAVATGALPGCALEDEIDGVPIFRRPAPDLDLTRDPGLLIRFVEAGVAIKQRWRPDIVHVHGSQLSAWINLLSGKAWPCPTVVTLHARLHLPRGVQQRVILEADMVTAVSGSLREEFADLAAARSEPMRVVINGLSAPHLAPSPLVFRPATALCYGRLVTEKGFDVALRALAQTSELRLVVAGDGIARPSLERLADELGITERVQFRGWAHPDSIPSLINEASFVLMPSRLRESFGLVAVEAALMGRPIIASRVGGIPEVVQDAETGFLVPSEDPAAIAATVSDLLEDPARARKMGARARERALEQFSIERCASEFESVYSKACERHS